MGVLDAFLQAAPGLYAKAKAGQQMGFDRRRQQLQENEDRQREAEQTALQQMILQSRMQEDQQTAPVRRRLLDAQTRESEARASDFDAQVRGIGRYAPKPVEPKFSLKTDRTGRVVPVNEATGLDREGKPVFERVPTGGNPGLDEERRFRRLASISDDYSTRTKDLRRAHQSIVGALDKIPEAAQGNGAAQVQLLYAFIKAFDPTSVVREGEIALAQRATPLWDWAKANVSKVANKSVLVPPEIVQQMGALMSDMADSYESNVNLEREALAVQGRLGRIDPADLEAALPKIGRPKAKAAPSGDDADAWAAAYLRKKRGQP